jgi:hypothetical protein
MTDSKGNEFRTGFFLSNEEEPAVIIKCVHISSLTSNPTATFEYECNPEGEELKLAQTEMSHTKWTVMRDRN